MTGLTGLTGKSMLAHKSRTKSPRSSIVRLIMPQTIMRTVFQVKRSKVKVNRHCRRHTFAARRQGHQVDYCWDWKCILYLVSTEQESLRTSKLVRRWSMLYALSTAIRTCEVAGFLYAGGCVPCRPHPAATQSVRWWNARADHTENLAWRSVHHQTQCTKFSPVDHFDQEVPHFTPKPFSICLFGLELNIWPMSSCFSLIFSFSYVMR